MFLESRNGTQIFPLIGLGGGILAILLLIGTGGMALVPSLMLLLISGYFIQHQYVESVVLNSSHLVLTTTRVFRTNTQYLPLTALKTNYRAAGGLRSAKHYVLEIYCQQKQIALLSPKEGFSSYQLDLLADALASRKITLP